MMCRDVTGLVIFIVAALVNTTSGIGDTEQISSMAAARFIVEKINSDYNWDAFTPRALVSLSFVKKLHLPEKPTLVNVLTRKFRDVLEKDTSGKSLPLHLLSQYINAFYALCKDPRDFYEIDLIDLLRTRTNEVSKADFNLPGVLLTLCLANETTLEDAEQLVSMYDQANGNTAMQSLAVISMAACADQTSKHYYLQMKNRVDNFVQELTRKKTIGSYTISLVTQAFNSWKIDTPLREELLFLQAEDGGFGDMLSTYAAIPAVLNSSLASLQCKRNYKAKSKKYRDQSEPEKVIDLTIVIPEGTNEGEHTMKVLLQGQESLLDLMSRAEQKNSLYRFTYDKLEKRINSVAGILNDVESCSNWVLYKINLTKDTNLKTMIRVVDGIDSIYPMDKDHFVLQLENCKM